MSENQQGKRGPNGGIVDIDDPHERFPLHDTVRDALSLVVKAANAERLGFPKNAAIYLANATDRIVRAIEDGANDR